MEMTASSFTNRDQQTSQQRAYQTIVNPTPQDLIATTGIKGGGLGIGAQALGTETRSAEPATIENRGEDTAPKIIENIQDTPAETSQDQEVEIHPPPDTIENTIENHQIIVDPGRPNTPVRIEDAPHHLILMKRQSET